MYDPRRAQEQHRKLAGDLFKTSKSISLYSRQQTAPPHAAASPGRWTASAASQRG